MKSEIEQSKEKEDPSELYKEIENLTKEVEKENEELNKETQSKEEEIKTEPKETQPKEEEIKTEQNEAKSKVESEPERILSPKEIREERIKTKEEMERKKKEEIEKRNREIELQKKFEEERKTPFIFAKFNILPKEEYKEEWERKCRYNIFGNYKKGEQNFCFDQLNTNNSEIYFKPEENSYYYEQIKPDPKNFGKPELINKIKVEGMVKVFIVLKEGTKLSSLKYLFAHCSSLIEVKFDTSFNSQIITDLTGTFYNCPNLKKIELSSLNTDNLENMFGTFCGCSSLVSLPDFIKINTSKVKSMRFLFAWCSSLLKIDFTKSNTENVEDMFGLLCGCSNLQEAYFSDKLNEVSLKPNKRYKNIINEGNSKFSTKKVKDMGFMFSKCINLTTLDLRGFSLEKVEKMNAMFADCSNLRELNVKKDFITEGVGDSQYIFQGCDKINVWIKRKIDSKVEY